MNEWNFAQIPEILAFSEFFSHFVKISRQFVISWPFLWNSGKISSNFRRKIAKFIEKREWKMEFHFHSGKKLDGFSLKFWDLGGAKVWESCRSRKTWKNEYLVAIVAVDTAENEPLKVWGRFHSSFIRLLITGASHATTIGARIIGTTSTAMIIVAAIATIVIYLSGSAWN